MQGFEWNKTWDFGAIVSLNVRLVMGDDSGSDNVEGRHILTCERVVLGWVMKQGWCTDG